MKQKYVLILFLTIALACTDSKDPNEKGLVSPGVPMDLASYRFKHISDLAYQLSFDIPLEKNEPIPSKLVLNFNLNSLDEPVYLDFKAGTDNLKSLRINGQESGIEHTNEHLFLARKYLKLGSNMVQINFIAGELSLNRNENYLYTLLVPDRARTLFPCFDQPNLKSSYTLQITAPNNWEVLCGAKEVSKHEDGSYTKHNFAPTDKISTYLFSFVAGEFETVKQGTKAFPMTLLYRETDPSKIEHSTDPIFRLHEQAMSFLETYTNHDFPFQKMDFAAIPGFQYGGMEHVGAIQYREDALFLDGSATDTKKLSRAKLIAHETSHMWFGNLVTMNWFNDVWMKEVFANFMADKIVNPAFLNINHQLAFMATHYPNAYGEDRTLGTNPIRQDLENLNNAGSLYGSIIYNKAPIMMRQLESVLGKEAFKTGIQEYIKTFAHGNAVWNDLITILDKKTETDISAWSAVWVNSAGRPIISDSIRYTEDDKIKTFKIIQRAEDKSENVWPQSFDIAFVYKDSIITIPVTLTEKSMNLEGVKGLAKPELIVYNANAEGYGVFPLQKGNVLKLPELKNEVTRGYAYINAYENMLLGNIDPITTLTLFRIGLAEEKNELLLRLISDYTTAIFWKYLPLAERNTHQEAITQLIWTRLQKKNTANIKKSLFSTYKALAFRSNSLDHLYSIWSKKLTITDLILNDDDFTEMALDLALYGHRNKVEVLNTTKSTLTNPDKLERFQFLLPSVSWEINIRNDFFESLKQEKNRAKESWVINALNNLNHPLHQKESLSYLRPSLDLLEEIQITGDIFFPKRWLNSTIGNYTSDVAFRILQDFLSDNPEINQSLKLKALQASDDLRRVQSMHSEIDKPLN